MGVSTVGDGSWKQHVTYALVDGAILKGDIITLSELAPDSVPLFQGDVLGSVLVSPILVDCKKHKRAFDYLESIRPHKPWGVYLNTLDSGRSLVSHLQGLLTPVSEHGEKLFFRYYDPRVFRVFIETCTVAQLVAIFGSISEYIVDCGEGSDVDIFSLDNGLLVKTRMADTDEAPTTVVVRIEQQQTEPEADDTMV